MSSERNERRTIDQARAGVEVRPAGEGEPRRLEGYAAVFYDGSPGTEYRLASDMVERIDPGAFDRAIREDDVRGVVNHDASLILGRNKAGTMELVVDEKGLRYDIDLPDTTTGRDVAVSVERGDITGSSFMFYPIKEEFAETGGLIVRTIKEAELFDVGPVTYPAYEGTSSEVPQIRARFEASRARRQRIARAKSL